jgi:hypothetical protein
MFNFTKILYYNVKMISFKIKLTFIFEYFPSWNYYEQNKRGVRETSLRKKFQILKKK